MRTVNTYLLGVAAAFACGAMLAGCGKNEAHGDAPKREGDELVLIVTPESPPFTHRGEDGEISGIDVELARAAAKKMGRPLKVVTAEFAKLLPAVKSGAADMAGAGITITDSRLRSVDFSDKYADDGGAFLYPKGAKTPTLVTAERLRIGTVDSSTHDFFLTNHGLDPIRYRHNELAIRDLALGKIDAAYTDHSTLSQFAAKSQGAFEVSPLITKEFIGIAVRKDMPELKAALNEAIRERDRK